MSLQETFSITHDSGDISGTGSNRTRTVQGNAADIGPVKIVVHVDVFTPSQGYAYLAMWTHERGFERLATLHGEELVTRQSGKTFHDARDTQDICDQLIDLASMMLGRPDND